MRWPWVKAAVKDEFDWLYGTEHYEPAIGAYSTMKPEVIARLKNPPSEASSAALLESIEPTWELLTGAEVGSRLGYPVTELPRDDAWGDADMSKIDRWICIPAAIHYAIWSDVYRCEGFVTVEEATGKISTRGKNVGKPIVKKRFVERGCRTLFRLWDVAVDFGAKEVLDSFQCPNCGQTWTIENATQLRTDATNAIYGFEGLNQHGRPSVRRRQRPLTGGEKRHLSDIDSSRPSTWYPTNSIVAGEQGNPFLNRGI